MKKKGEGKILVVDDEKFNCDIIDGFLMVLGFNNKEDRVEACYNGE
jgi:CheY-like chemotaxis protein